MTLLRRLDYPPVWLVAAMAIAWGLAQVWAPLGDRLIATGWALVLAGIGLAVWAALAFRRARTTIVPGEEPSALVETGPYRLSRNPIYLGDLMILAGWCLLLGSPLSLVVLIPLHQILLRRFVLPEEQLLAAHLGEPYDAYRARVRRWL